MKNFIDNSSLNNIASKFGTPKEGWFSVIEARAHHDAEALASLLDGADLFLMNKLTAKFGTPGKDGWASVISSRAHLEGAALAAVLKDEVGHVSGLMVQRAAPAKALVQPTLLETATVRPSASDFLHSLFSSILNGSRITPTAG